MPRFLFIILGDASLSDVADSPTDPNQQSLNSSPPSSLAGSSKPTVTCKLLLTENCVDIFSLPSLLILTLNYSLFQQQLTWLIPHQLYLGA